MAWSQHGDQAHKLSSLHFVAESFERHLERMFEYEEQEDQHGYMQAVEAGFPSFRAQAAEFRQQHRQFRATMQDLLRRLSQREHLSSAEAEQLFEDFSTLLDQIDRHNKQEMNLLEELILNQPAEQPPEK
jgi:hypothetical protein